MPAGGQCRPERIPRTQERRANGPWHGPNIRSHPQSQASGEARSQRGERGVAPSTPRIGIALDVRPGAGSFRSSAAWFDHGRRFGPVPPAAQVRRRDIVAVHGPSLRVWRIVARTMESPPHVGPVASRVENRGSMYSRIERQPPRAVLGLRRVATRSSGRRAASVPIVTFKPGAARSAAGSMPFPAIAGVRGRQIRGSSSPTGTTDCTSAMISILTNGWRLPFRTMAQRAVPVGNRCGSGVERWAEPAIRIGSTSFTTERTSP